MSERTVGTVYRLLKEKGYGFVRTQDGREAFLHRSACKDPALFDGLTEGDQVTFSESMNKRGLRAEDVS